MIKTYLIHKDDFNRWYQNLKIEKLKKIYDLKNWIEVLKKSEVEKEIETFEKKDDSYEVEEYCRFKREDWKNFKNKLLGSEKDKLDHNDTDSVSQRSSKGLKGIPSEKPKRKLKGEG